MDVRLLIPELFEKLSLIATCGLIGVLVPPLRNRLLGVGRPRDIAVVVIFGLLFSMWGSAMSFEWLGHQLNLRAIGIMIAGILGGPRAGALTGLLGGGFQRLARGLDHGLDLGRVDRALELGDQDIGGGSPAIGRVASAAAIVVERRLERLSAVPVDGWAELNAKNAIRPMAGSSSMRSNTTSTPSPVR